ncbi:copper transporter [Corynebacterium sp.]|uniref:copper transporter n=1 Tax=Corynebacterium sp. TaxID=1720 RepID=UPI0026DAB671|nr:copper transporter [Corynebacterium sp.]MDO4914700.1 copper transporter [Corynebacterium sp.]
MSHNRSGIAVAGAACGIALGTVFGVYVLGPHSGASSHITRHNVDTERKVDSVTAERNQANKSVQAADQLGVTLAPDAVKGRLQDKAVLIITTPDVNKDDVKAVNGLIEPAGAHVAGTIGLKDKFVSRDGGDDLKSIAATTLPAGVQLSERNSSPGWHIGQLMGGAFLKKSEGGDNAQEQSTGPERKIVRDSLTQGDFLTADGLDEPADVAILITGGSDGKKGNNDYVAGFLRDFTEGLGHNGSGVVAASRPGAAEDNGVIARLRDSHDGQENSQAKISTVDDINHVTGQVSAIRASADVITGKTGSYGIMDGATAAVAQ